MLEDVRNIGAVFLSRISRQVRIEFSAAKLAQSLIYVSLWVHDNDSPALVCGFNYVFPSFEDLEAVGLVWLEIVVLYVKTKLFSWMKYIFLNCLYVQFELLVSV